MAGTLILLEDVDVQDLPPLAREMVALIGFGATIRLVEQRPGIPTFIPKSVPATNHWMLCVLNGKAAEALVKIRQRHILKSREDGYSQTEAALLHGVTPRWIRALESREPEEDRNGRLF